MAGAPPNMPQTAAGLAASSNPMPANELNVEDYSESPYAEELLRGSGSRRFHPPVEAEYLSTHLRRVQLRVRVWFSLGLILAVGFSAADWRGDGLWDARTVIQLFVDLPCALALSWLCWSSFYERHFFRVAALLVPLKSAALAVILTLHITEEPGPLAVLAVNLFAVFFFTGLLFKQALLAAAMALLAFAVAAIAANLPLPVVVESGVILCVTAAMTAIVYWDVEQSYRRSFLEGSLLREVVSRDGFSGLTNRRAFDEHLRRIWQIALREQRHLAVFMIDIDYFKRYNDELGHQAGDHALKSVANVIRGFARRPLDVAARYGGEEFAVILYDPTFEHVQQTADRIREAVQNLDMPSNPPGSQSRQVTVSVGAGMAAPGVGRTPQGAVQLADEALYEAKLAGRNCVVAKGIEDYLLLDTGAFKTPRKSARRVDSA